ncbi:MAG: ATPase domain-containing protein [Candidatus Dormibacteria bacterium]
MALATARDGLESAVGLIQARFGSAALHRASSPSPWEADPASHTDAIATGIPALDTLTGVGGLPTGRLSVLLGACGSGKTMLAYRFLASLSEQAAAVLWLDLTGQADPWLMARLGVHLDRLLLMRPLPGGELAPSLEAALALVRAGVGGLIVDLPGGASRSGASRSGAWDPMAATLSAACARAAIPFLALGETAGDPLRYAASLVLRLRRMERVWHHGDVVGVRVAVSVEKNKVGTPGRTAEVQLDYPLGGFFPPAIAAAPGTAAAVSAAAAGSR